MSNIYFYLHSSKFFVTILLILQKLIVVILKGHLSPPDDGFMKPKHVVENVKMKVYH
jgi:hypothetical protein